MGRGSASPGRPRIQPGGWPPHQDHRQLKAQGQFSRAALQARSPAIEEAITPSTRQNDSPAAPTSGKLRLHQVRSHRAVCRGCGRAGAAGRLSSLGMQVNPGPTLKVWIRLGPAGANAPAVRAEQGFAVPLQGPQSNMAIAAGRRDAVIQRGCSLAASGAAAREGWWVDVHAEQGGPFLHLLAVPRGPRSPPPRPVSHRPPPHRFSRRMQPPDSGSRG